jgi:hypothetical protein
VLDGAELSAITEPVVAAVPEEGLWAAVDNQIPSLQKQQQQQLNQQHIHVLVLNTPPSTEAKFRSRANTSITLDTNSSVTADIPLKNTRGVHWAVLAILELHVGCGKGQFL